MVMVEGKGPERHVRAAPLYRPAAASGLPDKTSALCEFRICMYALKTMT
jgi:hypothetical protein